MKKQLKLKRWVKVVLTAVIIITSTFIYSKSGIIGELAQANKIYQIICIGAWMWLLPGQMITYSLIWRK